MNAATLTRDALIPRNPDGLGRGLLMAPAGLLERQLTPKAMAITSSA